VTFDDARAEAYVRGYSEGLMPTVVGLTPATVYESVAGGPVRTRPR
jgi:hypothetical protein